MSDIKVSALTEATQNELTDSALTLASVVDANSSTGFSSRKSTLAKLATYILNTFSGLSLGGVTRTVKAAIDATQTTVASHTSTLGSTSISGVGDGTVTGAISSLNSDLAQLSQLIYIKTFTCENITITAGTAGTRGGQKTVDVAVSGYTPIAVGLTQVNDSSLANVVPFFGSNGNPNTVFVNVYRASGSAGTVSGIYFRVIYIKS